MSLKFGKKALLIGSLCAGLFAVQVFAQGAHKHHDDDDKPTNLKVLPKDISEDKLDDIMKNFSKSLGVRCNYCHVAHDVPGREHPKMDFASDDKPEKQIARDMIKMSMAINSDYLAKMGDHKMEEIRCVTCHGGRTKPIVSVDSIGHNPPPMPRFTPPPPPQPDNH